MKPEETLVRLVAILTVQIDVEFGYRGEKTNRTHLASWFLTKFPSG